MRLLVLGGTAFVGRAIAQQALDRGHAVTCAARGSAAPPRGCAFVRLDRDRDDALDPLRELRWDAVVDVSRTPRHVERAVRKLTARHWVFISSGNVYARHDQREPSESAPVLEPLVDDSVEDYGRAKVSCEQLVRGAEGSSTVIRAGLVGGAGDVSGRSGYYPWRFSSPSGPDVLVPGDPEFPVALVDVADLAGWVVLAAEERLDSTFNVAGPSTTLLDAVEASSRAVGGSVPPRWVEPGLLAEAGVRAWSGERSLPLWVDDPVWRWFATLDTSAAVSAGLVTRPLEDTLADASAYEHRRRRSDPDGHWGAGLSDVDEHALRLWLDRR